MFRVSGMNQATMLKGMLVGGIIGILIGLMFIGLGATLPAPVSTVYFIFGGFVTLFSIAFTLRVNKAIKKVSKKSALSKAKALAIALVIVAVTAFTLSVAQASIRECVDAWRRVMYVQYVMLGFLIVAGFLAFAPVILGRTILGPILGELQYMAGAMLLILIFAVLLVFPLDALFYVNDPLNPTECFISLENLRYRGPYVLRIILNLLMPPMPQF